ncbi:hypothetical protein B0T11DRAFT_299207 [Plectosphaerella cucumerina]|uniref:Uncharacterized protein n=1 Tax=Plectosphaerella cucumerina TaxID=40658 RepID=A0A8K0TGC4_9PEZI|nr:hypothetical protein B0T11DRAFT_299207 [Plectosphaerella cucumerina]
MAALILGLPRSTLHPQEPRASETLDLQVHRVAERGGGRAASGETWGCHPETQSDRRRAGTAGQGHVRAQMSSGSSAIFGATFGGIPDTGRPGQARPGPSHVLVPVPGLGLSTERKNATDATASSLFDWTDGWAVTQGRGASESEPASDRGWQFYRYETGQGLEADSFEKGTQAKSGVVPVVRPASRGSVLLGSSTRSRAKPGVLVT